MSHGRTQTWDLLVSNTTEITTKMANSYLGQFIIQIEIPKFRLKNFKLKSDASTLV